MKTNEAWSGDFQGNDVEEAYAAIFGQGINGGFNKFNGREQLQIILPSYFGNDVNNKNNSSTQFDLYVYSNIEAFVEYGANHVKKQIV